MKDDRFITRGYQFSRRRRSYPNPVGKLRLNRSCGVVGSQKRVITLELASVDNIAKLGLVPNSGDSGVENP